MLPGRKEDFPFGPILGSKSGKRRRRRFFFCTNGELSFKRKKIRF
jgi:hypothetical protein